MKLKTIQSFIILFSAVSVLTATACTRNDPPPYIRVKITDRADNVIFVNNFKLIYWWEERNETPYLEPYHLSTKKLIIDVMTPLKDNPRQIKTTTRTFPLQNIKAIRLNHKATGFDLLITTLSGEQFEASNNFPKQLKKNPDSGIADSLFFAAGTVFIHGSKKPYKKSFNLLKDIQILNASSHPETDQ